MAPPFKRNFITFLLLHLAFAILVLFVFRVFIDKSAEIFAYLFWFVVIFGILATLFQSVIYAFILSKAYLTRLTFFISVLFIELTLLNCMAAYAGGIFITGDLINDVKNNSSWEDMSIPLLIHISLFLSTLIISLARPVYKKITL
jgi:hypothetical protein